MKRFSLLSKLAIALSIGTSLAGCHPPKPVTATPPVDPTLAIPRWRFIGTRTTNECPKIHGWKERPVYEKSAKDIPEYFSRQCIYENHWWFERRPPRHDDLKDVHQDPVAISPAGLEELVQPRLSVQFFEQVGRPLGRPLLLPIDETRPKVRVAFLDTHPTTSDFSSRRSEHCASGHGDFLRHLARALTCERNQCMTKITTQLALPIQRFDRDRLAETLISEKCGGYIGSFEHLTAAINKEVSAWSTENEGLPDSQKIHLILNLSLSWSGADFSRSADSYCDVYLALANAASKGALIIAAVGNDRSGPGSEDGARLPARWATEPPVPGECPEAPLPLTVPLLYAVGGLRSDNQPLANLQRPNSMPELAAYADHAALGPFIALPSWQTSTYTGTSVAAAVVSSIAAVVWHENHGLSAQEVIELVRSSGQGLKLHDSQMIPGSTEVRRASLCRALATARAGGSPSLADCEVLAAEPIPDRPDVPLMLSDLLDDGSSGDSSIQWTTVIDPWSASKPTFHRGADEPMYCQRGTYYVPEGEELPLPADLCPSDVIRDVRAEPWLHPAPANEPCPSCTDPPHRSLATISAGPVARSLHIEIRNDWAQWSEGGGTLVSASLEVKEGGSLTRYFIPGPFYGNSPRRLIFPVPPTGFNRNAQVTLNWKVHVGSGYYSIRTPVFIAD